MAGFDVGAIVARLELNADKWNTAIQKVTQDKSLSGYILRNEQSIKSLGKSFTIAGAGVIASFGMMVKKAADYGDAMNDLSQRTGVGVDVLSGLKLAVDKSGSSMEGFAIGIKGLSVNMSEANAGSKEAAALFKSLGIDVADANGNLKSSGDVLFELADKFEAMEDGTAKTTLAVKLFGKSGMELIPTLNMGSKGLRENRAEAERLGLVLDQKAAKAADAFNDQLQSLKGAFMGVALQAGQTLMPAIQSIVKGVTNVIAFFRKWAEEHPVLSGLILKLALGVGALMTALGPVLIALPTLIKLKAGLKAILPGLEAGIKGISVAQVAAGAAFGTAIVLVAKYAEKLHELKQAEDELRDASERQAQAENRVIDKLSEAAVAAGWHFGRMSDLIKVYDGNIAALEMAIKRGKEGIDIQNALAEVSKKTKAAYDALHVSTNNVAGASLEKNKALTEQISIETTAAGSARVFGDIIGQAATKMEGLVYSTDAALPPMRTFWADVAEKAPAAFDEANEAVYSFGGAIRETMSEVSTIVSDAIRNVAETIVGVFNLHEMLTYQAKEFDSSLYESMQAAAEKAYDAVKKAIEDQIDAVKEAYEEQREAISDWYDAAKEAADDYYDGLVKAARDAYDAAALALDRYYEKVKRQAERSYDLADRQYARAYEAQEIRYAREYEDQERKYKREYERKKKAIEDSNMTEEEKQAALKKLEEEYERDRIKRERQYENQKRQREIKYENEKMQRQIQHENKMTEIDRRARNRERQLQEQLANRLEQLAKQRENREKQLMLNKEKRERAAEERAEKRQKELMAALLKMQEDHEADIARIRAAEEAARDRHADNEEKRQSSLWNKVKGIFATAIEQMATVWLTRLIGQILPSFDSIGNKAEDVLGEKGLGKTVSNASTSISNVITKLAATIGTVLTTLATAIGTVVTTFATSISTALVTISTAIATAATTLAAAAPALLEVGLVAAAIYTAFKLGESLVAAIGGLFKSGNNTDITYWLKMIWENTKETRDFLHVDIRWWLEKFDVTFADIKTGIWLMATDVNYIRTKIPDQLKNIYDGMVPPLRSINNQMKILVGVAEALLSKGGSGGGGYKFSPVPYMPTSSGMRTATAAGTSAGINITFNITAIDSIDTERFIRDKAKPAIERTIQRALRTRNVTVPSFAVGGN